MTNIERIPAIVALNRFAERLPPEHRYKLYETAFSFLSIGCGHGITAGLASSLNVTSKGGQQEEWLDYLQQKARENKVPA